MKRSIMPYVLLQMLLLCTACSDNKSSELFPLPDITVGMLAKDLSGKYPVENLISPREHLNRALETGGVIDFELTGNKFWNLACIHIDHDARVKYLLYSRVNANFLRLFLDESKDNKIVLEDDYLESGYDDIVKNVPLLLKHLKQQLGVSFEKKIAYLSSENDSPCDLYIWKRGKDVVAFNHTPFDFYKKGEPFICQLTISSTYESLNGIYRSLTDSTRPNAP